MLAKKRFLLTIFFCQFAEPRAGPAPQVPDPGEPTEPAGSQRDGAIPQPAISSHQPLLHSRAGGDQAGPQFQIYMFYVYFTLTLVLMFFYPYLLCLLRKGGGGA